MRTKILLVSTLLVLAILSSACGGQITPPTDVAGAVNTAAGAVSTLAASTEMQGQAEAASTLAASTEVQGQAEAAGTLVASTAVQTAVVEDFNTLINTLQATGMNVEAGDQITQPFFSVTGQTLKVNGQDVQVFVYDTAQAMEAEAAQIAADGSTIGTSMPSWMDDPHFFKNGRILLLYLGQDQKIMDILSGIFGPQFAGR